MNGHSSCPVCEADVRYERFFEPLPCPRCGTWLKAVHECDMGGCLEYLELASEQEAEVKDEHIAALERIVHNLEERVSTLEESLRSVRDQEKSQAWEEWKRREKHGGDRP